MGISFPLSPIPTVGKFIISAPSTVRRRNWGVCGAIVRRRLPPSQHQKPRRLLRMRGLRLQRLRASDEVERRRMTSKTSFCQRRITSFGTGSASGERKIARYMVVAELVDVVVADTLQAAEAMGETKRTVLRTRVPRTM